MLLPIESVTFWVSLFRKFLYTPQIETIIFQDCLPAVRALEVLKFPTCLKSSLQLQEHRDFTVSVGTNNDVVEVGTECFSGYAKFGMRCSKSETREYRNQMQTNKESTCRGCHTNRKI